MSKRAKNERKERKIIKVIYKLFVVAIFLVGITTVLSIAGKNYVRNDIKDKTNLIINNSNVTSSLKKDLYVENGIVYVAMQDIKNFLDNTITYDEKYNQIITCSENKVASLPVESREISINSSNTTIKGMVEKKDDTYYLPISELGLVYNISTNYIEETNIVTIDSLDRAYIVATASEI